MSYQVLTTDDDAYQRTITYVQKRCPGELRVASQRRHMLGVEDLTDEAIEELQTLGAEVVEDFEYAMDATVRR